MVTNVKLPSRAVGANAPMAPSADANIDTQHEVQDRPGQEPWRQRERHRVETIPTNGDPSRSTSRLTPSQMAICNKATALTQ